jgi:hypothetical protein
VVLTECGDARHVVVALLFGNYEDAERPDDVEADAVEGDDDFASARLRRPLAQALTLDLRP